MSENPAANESSSKATELAPTPISLYEFLLSCPPGNVRMLQLEQKPPNSFKVPSLILHCESQHCDGERVFACYEARNYLPSDSSSRSLFFEYVCRNCGAFRKTFSFRLSRQADTLLCEAYKFGEYPRFGPHIPSRVITLIRDDRELFVKGRTAESLGLGIAAFAYYRRVVENQKSRIFDRILSVATALEADADLISELTEAKQGISFSDGIDKIKHAIPDSLRIDGHNPLTLLHAALSEGVHELSDNTCLEIATDIRVVLTALSEKLANALKDDAEFKNSVSRLLAREQARRSQKSPDSGQAPTDSGDSGAPI